MYKRRHAARQWRTDRGALQPCLALLATLLALAARNRVLSAGALALQDVAACQPKERLRHRLRFRQGLYQSAHLDSLVQLPTPSTVKASPFGTPCVFCSFFSASGHFLQFELSTKV